MEKIQQSPITDQEKQEALATVLSSTAFGRSAQLRLFLTYVCERDMAGHPDDLTEYQIAVNVLGRQKDFNLTDDSAVRNRAYELRQRLEKFYLTEQPDAPVEIQIPRGGYVPNYVRRAAKLNLVPEVVSTQEVAAAAQQSLDPVATPAKTGRVPAWGAVLIGCLIAATGAWTGSYFARPHPPAILRDAWGPLVTPGDDLLICIATNLHLIVRQHLAPDSTALRFEAPPEAFGFYGNVRRPLDPGLPLYMTAAQLSIPLAEVVAATTLCHISQMFGDTCRLLPESEAPIASLRGRSAVLIGSGTNSSAATLLLEKFPYTIDFSANDKFAVLDRRLPAEKRVVYLAGPTGDRVASQHYGLLTVISTVDVSGAARRTLVLSGSSSGAVQAAAEFFSSPDQMRSLLARFRKQGLSGFPPNYQVLIKCQTSGVRLIAYDYMTHAVVP